MPADPPDTGTGLPARFRRIIDVEDGAVVGVETRATPDGAGLLGPVAEWVDHQRAVGGTAPDLFLTPEPTLWGRRDAAGLVDQVLFAAGVDPAHVVVTVNGAGERPTEPRRSSLAGLARSGIRVALGVVGSSLPVEWLLERSISVVRLDAGLVPAAGRDRRAAGVLARLVDLVTELGLDPLADFVDDDEARALVDRVGFRFAAGDQVGEAVPLDELDLGFAGPVRVDLSGNREERTLSWGPPADR